ncbi:MAG: S-layer protein, partial [Isosphaera sp.]|nr:S-layer protein [Isosphaera sp.]
SLFGFEPADDYDPLVKEGRGRRVFASSPANSLLLLKATGAVAHAGGKRLDVGSPAYELLRRWIAEGARPSPASEPALDRITVTPPSRVLARGAAQKLVVVAHLRDGTTRDVTHLSQFEANPPDLLAADPTGLVTAKQKSGSAAVTVRHRDRVAVVAVTIPFGTPVTTLPPAKTFADELVFKKLKDLGLPPSELCDDATFLRRVTVDICGRLPTKEEAEAFAADRSADKVERLVDRLLADPGYADYFANKWSAVLRNRRAAANDDPKPTAAFHAWIRDSFQQNKPFDRFVREVLTAAGTSTDTPPTVWYRELKDPASLAEDAAQLFLGQRIACAKCHHHPHDRWSQADYWAFAAAFSRTDIAQATALKKGNPNKQIPDTPGKPLTVSHKPGAAGLPHPRTGATVRPAGLGADPFALAADADPRAALAGWVTDPKNPYFARALANRYWKHFLGRGLVDPEDDLRATNPASNPELLDALAARVVADGFDLKKLVRVICTSSVYRLSSEPNAHNADDRQHFARFYPRRLHAEVLLDAVDAVTLAKTKFRGAADGTRAVQLPDNQFDSYFLSVFGRPEAASACECERGSDANLAQALLLFNSDEMLTKIGVPPPRPPDNPKARPDPNAPPRATPGDRLTKLLADQRPHPDRVRDLYLTALSREPTADELAAVTAHIGRKGDDRAAYADVLWALLNTKEFLFTH